MTTRFLYGPKVRCVGHSRALGNAFMDWVESTGEDWYGMFEFVNHPRHGRTVDHLGFMGKAEEAVLTEFAGRVCYASFGPRQSKRSTEEYITNLLEQGHGCYDGETQVLTSQGWKTWPEVTEQDYLATRTSAGILEYQRPSRLIAYHHQGRMYQVAGPSVDLLVTPDHKMLACLTTTKEGRRKRDYTLIPAEELGNKAHAYVRNVEEYTPFSAMRLSDIDFDESLAALLGFAIGDGYYTPDLAAVRFHLHRERKVSWLQQHAELAGLILQQHANNKWALVLPTDIRGTFAEMYDAHRDKRIPPSALHWPVSLQRALFEGLMASDGCRTDTGDIYDTTSGYLAGQLQQLALHLGFAATISQAQCYRERSRAYGDKPIHRVSFITRALKPEVNKFRDCAGKTEWVEDWKGMVYCAEVPNHTLYVRRNGKPVWSGNSVFEHVSWTFHITGVSRALTHELIRHRVGVAISQLSQRYVDNPQRIAFVVPPILQGSEEASLEFGIFRDTCVDALKSYGDLLAIYTQKLAAEQPDLPARDRKKMAAEAARAVLPNATATELVWTVNARALRNFLYKRGGPGVEREMRTFACTLAKWVLFDNAGILFPDLTVEAAADGIEAVVLQHAPI